MKRRSFKFMVYFYTSTLLVACAFGNPTIEPTPTLATPTARPITPTSISATTTLAISTIPPPTFSFNSTPFPTPTSVGGGPFKLVAGINEIFPGSQWADLQSAQGATAWLLTDKGIARVSDLGWTIFLSSYEGYLIGMDSTDRAWVISEAGDSISAWERMKWTKYSGENGWATVNDPQSFNRAYLDLNNNNFAELPGQIWLSTPEDVRLFDGVRWKIFTPEDMGMTLRSNENISSASAIFHTFEIEAFQSTGEVWVGECDSEPFSFPDDGSGARWFDGKAWRGKSTPVQSGCVHAIHEDRSGNIWMAVNFSLWRYTPSTPEWVNFTLTEFSANSQSSIFDIAIGDVDEPWIITQAVCSGGGTCAPPMLYHLEEGVWRPLNVNVLHELRILNLAGHVWLVDQDGVYAMVDGKAQFPQLVSNLIVSDWTMDTAGKVWAVGRDMAENDKISLWIAIP